MDDSRRTRSSDALNAYLLARSVTNDPSESLLAHIKRVGGVHDLEPFLKVAQAEFLRQRGHTIDKQWPEGRAEFVAILQKEAASPAFLLTFNFERRVMTVRTVGAEKQAGKSYELWLVSDKFPAPRSLGLVGAEEFATRRAIAGYDQVTINNATYAISLEPEGGSPTGVRGCVTCP